MGPWSHQENGNPVLSHLEDVWLQFSEQEWRALRGWQRALHQAIMRSNYHILLNVSVSVHDENTKRDPAVDCFESTARDSEVPGRPGEQFSKDPSPGVLWDSQWNSEMMETNTTGNSLGDDTRHARGFGEHLDFFSAQENSVRMGPCTYTKQERNSTQQEHLQAPQGAREGEVSPDPTCERSLNERAFCLLHSQPCAAGEKGTGQEPASASYQGLPMGPHLITRPDCGQNPMGEPGLHEHHGLGGEEQPPAESKENFPAENPLASPCWDHPQDKAEACSRCQQHLAPRGSPTGQQQGQGRGKSYICSDCGKSFVCHSWLVRHQMTHTGERPYKCSKCDKSYRRKDYLLNHLRRHSGERLFQCSLCRKRFVLRRSLLKHQESHLPTFVKCFEKGSADFLALWKKPLSGNWTEGRRAHEAACSCS
uniref:Zinc finger protein 282 n=1 Tax=Strigops habroptila TaxID=2489341 RepID=A0A672TZ22_STRHB